MTHTTITRIPTGFADGTARRAPGLLDRTAERAGLALLAWAAHHRAAGRRTVDLARAPLRGTAGRPFC